MNNDYHNYLKHVVSSDLVNIAKAWRELHETGIWPDDSPISSTIKDIQLWCQLKGVNYPPAGDIKMNIVAMMQYLIIDNWLNGKQ